jgi:GNAT superfamily N-acetyltransferase
MTRRIVRLQPEHLAALDAPCGSCLFWERDPVARQRALDPAAEKAGWIAEVEREWGPCGQTALVDDVPVGYVLYAPAAFVPGAGAFPTAPVSPDAVLLTVAHVVPSAAGGGVGRMLVQRMARDLLKRDVRAVEAFGDERGGRSCVLPVGFLEAVGFRTHRGHGSTPRMRMDLRTTVPWRREVEAAWGRLVGVVRPAPKTSRAPKATPINPVSFGARGSGDEVAGRRP